MIPAGFLQDLIARVDLVELIGRHVELKRSGSSWTGLCPFHAERSPSFNVVPAKQFYHCFGCGASGDAIRFLTEHAGMSFVEAVRELAQGVGMTVPEEQVSPEEREQRQKLRERRLSIGELLERAEAFYRAQLKTAPRAIDYLKRRGLTGAIAARYGLGWAPPGRHALAGVFAQYDDPLLEEAGLVRRREEDGERHDWFRERVMFPIRGVDGAVIGFGGRVLDDSKPKYMNSPETPVFSKGRELYGLFEGRQALREKGYALVVEGYMDVVALAQHGFPNAVATLGTACTADHVQKLFRFTDRVVFAFDGDAAGRRAAARALEAALPHATDLRGVKFLFLPSEHDPDSYVRELGPEAFERAVAQAVPLSRQLVEQAALDCDLETAEGRAKFASQARPLWEALPDGLLRQQLLAELAAGARMDVDALARAWGRAAGRRAAPTGGGAAAPAGPGAAPSTAFAPRRRGGSRPLPPAPAEVAIRLLLRHSEQWLELPAEDQHLLHELDGERGGLVRWLERQLLDHGPLSWSALADALQADDTAEPGLHAAALRIVAAAPEDEPEPAAALRRVLGQLWIARLEGEAAEAVRAGDLPALRELRERIAQFKRPPAG